MTIFETYARVSGVWNFLLKLLLAQHSNRVEGYDGRIGSSYFDVVAE
jgi:hypothetical protein